MGKETTFISLYIWKLKSLQTIFKRQGWRKRRRWRRRESLLIQLEYNVSIDKINLFLGTFDTLIKVIKHIQKENLYALDDNSIFFLIIFPEWIEKEALKSNSDFLDFSTPRKANRYINIQNHLKNSIEGLKLIILIKRNDFDYSDVENKLIGNELSIMTEIENWKTRKELLADNLFDY